MYGLTAWVPRQRQLGELLRGNRIPELEVSASPRGDKSVLVIDWPTRDVPASLAFAGFTVFVKGCPGPADYAAWELGRGDPVSRPLGREPGQVDLVYCHRPFGELAGIIAQATRLGARALWWQTGLTSGGGKDPSGCWVPPGESRQARELAAAAGLTYIDGAYIADAARARG